MTSKGITVTYYEKFALLKKDEVIIGIAKLNGNLYELIVNVKKEAMKSGDFIIHEASGGKIQTGVHEEKLLKVKSLVISLRRLVEIMDLTKLFRERA